MIFDKSACNLPVVEWNGIALEKVLYNWFLGIIIDYILNWENHNQTVKNMVCRAVGAIYKIKDKVDKSVSLLIYHSLIIPHCYTNWNITKRVVKIMCGFKLRIIVAIGLVR